MTTPSNNKHQDVYVPPVLLRVRDAPISAAAQQGLASGVAIAPIAGVEAMGIELAAYAGTGVPVRDHPAQRDIGDAACPACRSADTLVLYYARTGLSMDGADIYEFEIVCRGCGAYALTQFDDSGM